jgi:hypothetical protein
MSLRFIIRVNTSNNGTCKSAGLERLQPKPDDGSKIEGVCEWGQVSLISSRVIIFRNG